MPEPERNATIQILVDETGLKSGQVEKTVALLEEGATVPFIARYRKEATGELDEVEIRLLQERLGYHKEMNERRQTIFKSIEEQGKLTPELRSKIEATRQKTELEDLYLPFKPKRRTKASIAREHGLEPLAEQLLTARGEGEAALQLAEPFVNPELEGADCGGRPDGSGPHPCRTVRRERRSAGRWSAN